MPTDDDYYDREEIVVSWRYKIEWNKSNVLAREDALRLARRGTQDAGAAGLHGCYGARRLGVVSEADPRRALAERLLAHLEKEVCDGHLRYADSGINRMEAMQVLRLALGRSEPEEDAG